MRQLMAKLSLPVVLALAGLLAAPSTSSAWYFPWYGGYYSGPYVAGYYGTGYYPGFYSVGYYGGYAPSYAGYWPGYSGGCCGGCSTCGFASYGCSTCGCAPCGCAPCSCSPCAGGCCGASLACASCAAPAGTSSDCWNATPTPGSQKPPKPIPEDGKFRARTPPTYENPPDQDTRPPKPGSRQRDQGFGPGGPDGAPVPQPKEPETAPKKPDLSGPGAGKTGTGDKATPKDPDLFDGKQETNKPLLPVQQRNADKKAPALQLPDEEPANGASTPGGATKPATPKSDATQHNPADGTKNPNAAGKSAVPAIELQDRPTWRYTAVTRQVEGRIASLSTPVPRRLQPVRAEWALQSEDGKIAQR